MQLNIGVWQNIGLSENAITMVHWECSS